MSATTLLKWTTAARKLSEKTSFTVTFPSTSKLTHARTVQPYHICDLSQSVWYCIRPAVVFVTIKTTVELLWLLCIVGDAQSELGGKTLVAKQSTEATLKTVSILIWHVKKCVHEYHINNTV